MYLRIILKQLIEWCAEDGYGFTNDDFLAGGPTDFGDGRKEDSSRIHGVLGKEVFLTRDSLCFFKVEARILFSEDFLGIEIRVKEYPGWTESRIWIKTEINQTLMSHIFLFSEI